MSTQRRTLAIALVGALVVGLLVVVAWWFAPYGETAEEGEQVALGTTVFSDIDGFPRLDREVEVRLPHGALAVSVSEPLDSLPHGLPLADEGELDDGDLHAPRGHEFLALVWTAQGSVTSSALENVGGGAAEDDEVAVALRAGDQLTEIDTDADDERDTGWGGHRGAVAVVVDDDDLEGAVLEVTFDGLTQVVSLADGSVEQGAAAPLYDWDTEPRASVAPRCLPKVSAPRGFEVEDAVCQVQVAMSPWTREQGWAEDGGVWTVVEATTVVADTLGREGDHGSTWSATVVEHDEGVDGVAPLAPLRMVPPEDSETFGTEGTGLLVFATSATDPGTLTMRQELVLARDLGRGGPLPLTVDFTADLQPSVPSPEQP